MVARLFADAGVHVPAILDENLREGFLLLSDLGNRTYLQALDPATAPPLYADANEALIKIQLASRAGVLPEYDRALLLRELRLFPDWYVSQAPGHHAHPGPGRDPGRRLRADPGQQPRPAARLRASRLSLPQPDGERAQPWHPGLSGRRLRADHLRPGVAVPGRLHRLGRAAPARLGHPLLGEGAQGAAAGARGLRRLLSRLRADGGTAPDQGAGDLRAPVPPRRQERLPQGHAAGHDAICARPASATTISIPCSSCWTSSKSAGPRAGYTF